VDLSRVKQKFSAASRKLKKSAPKPHNQDDEADEINALPEEDALAVVINEAEAEVDAVVEEIEAE